jgi:hypothetical protein
MGFPDDRSDQGNQPDDQRADQAPQDVQNSAGQPFGQPPPDQAGYLGGQPDYPGESGYPGDQGGYPGQSGPDYPAQSGTGYPGGSYPGGGNPGGGYHGGGYPGGGYPRGGYPGGGFPGGPVVGKVNGLSIAALVCGLAQFLLWFFLLVPGFIAAMAAVILGLIGLGQIRRRGESGRGMALAGILLGGLGVLAGVALAILIGVGTTRYHYNHMNY